MSMHLRGSRDLMDNDDYGWWRSRTGLEQKLIILVTLLFIVTFALVISVIVLKNRKHDCPDITTVGPVVTTPTGEPETTPTGETEITTTVVTEASSSETAADTTVVTEASSSETAADTTVVTEATSSETAADTTGKPAAEGAKRSLPIAEYNAREDKYDTIFRSQKEKLRAIFSEYMKFNSLKSQGA